LTIGLHGQGTYGEYDIRPTVTFPAAEHYHALGRYSFPVPVLLVPFVPLVPLIHADSFPEQVEEENEEELDNPGASQESKNVGMRSNSNTASLKAGNGDGAGNIVEENSSVFSLIRM